MGDYASAAEYYDLLYQGMKDYPAEAELVRSAIMAVRPDARTPPAARPLAAR